VGESGRGGKQRRAIRYRFFFALALTRLSNTVLRIGVCAVWNGFMAVWRSLRKKKGEQRREDTDLDIQLPEVIKEHFDPVVVLCLVEDDKLHICSSS